MTILLKNILRSLLHKDFKTREQTEFVDLFATATLKYEVKNGDHILFDKDYDKNLPRESVSGIAKYTPGCLMVETNQGEDYVSNQKYIWVLHQYVEVEIDDNCPF
jgi:hypothetical protein|tara:strand:- start:215 stop:529 length:315 start_codon:yes stop_codon:yes gene_type:complete